MKKFNTRRPENPYFRTQKLKVEGLKQVDSIVK